MNRKRRIIGILVLAGALTAGAWIAGLFSEEARVKRAVAQGVKAFEREDLEGCLEFISERYEDALGWDKPRIREGLVRLFVQVSEIKAEVGGLNVSLEKERATVKCEMRVRARGEGMLMFLVGSPTEKQEAVLFWAKEKGKWRLVRVEGLGVRE